MKFMNNLNSFNMVDILFIILEKRSIGGIENDFAVDLDNV